jgi:hypothetical protein
MSLIGNLAAQAESKVAINEVFRNAAMNKAVHLALGKPEKEKRWIVICPEACTAANNLPTLEAAQHAKKMAEDAGHKANEPLEYEQEVPILNYCEDLNACYQMEEYLWNLPGNEGARYVENLGGSSEMNVCAIDYWLLLHATPPQRVKAFLETVSTPKTAGEPKAENATAAE